MQIDRGCLRTLAVSTVILTSAIPAIGRELAVTDDPQADENAMLVGGTLDAARLTGTLSGSMSIDGAPGDLDVNSLTLRGLLPGLIGEYGGWAVVPFLSYTFTDIDFSGTAAGFPIGDEDLHTISLNNLVFRTFCDKAWLVSGWTRASVSTDFQSFGSDDWFFDIGGGAGYRVNDRLMLGVGAAVTDLSGDPAFFIGPNFDYAIDDKTRVGFYGPFFIFNHDFNDDWQFGIRGEPGGGIWNIRDDGGRSRNIEFSSYRLGVNVGRRIAGDWWFGAMVGVTLGNDIAIKNPGGGNRIKYEADESMFGQILLRRRIW